MSPQRIVAAMHTAPWLVGLSMLGLALAVVVYTGHTPRLVSVGVFALALVALLLYPRRLTPWLIGTAVLGLALVLLFYRLGDGSLHDFDEAIYAQATKEMLHLHVWGTPYWNGSLFLHKPPLYFWLTALTYQLLGVNEFAARFWSALFGFGVIGLTFVLGVRIRSWAVGAGAVLLLFGVIHKAYGHDFNFMSQARVGMLDVPLTFWIVGALALILEAEKRPRLIMLIGIPAGLAVMTKAWPGGFALVIPLVYWLFTRRGCPHYISYWLIAGLLASAIMLPWHLWQLWVHGHLFFHEYVSVNLIGRMSRLIEIDPLPHIIISIC
jgi:4-amino-4-deoxy-L-arabinose transferase-like glycosyltransferase